MQTIKPVVSIIVAAHNGTEITIECLKSLSRQDFQPLEIILVDNGSPENLAKIAAADFPHVTTITLPRNRGFAAGYNTGIRAAAGKFIAIINNDAIADSNWISTLVAAAENNPDAGTVTSPIFDGNRPDVLDSFGIGLALDGMSRQCLKGKGLPTVSGPEEILIASGCACLFRREALAEVGLFDEDFFAYCEDTDLGLRMQWAGYRTLIVPGTRVVHYYSRTLGKYNPKKVYLVERNHLWAAAKNFPLLLLPLVPVFTLWRYILVLWYARNTSSEMGRFVGNTPLSEMVMSVLKAYLAGFCRMPSMFRKRVKDRSRRKIGSIAMMKKIFRFKLPMKRILLGDDDAG